MRLRSRLRAWFAYPALLVCGISAAVADDLDRIVDFHITATSLESSLLELSRESGYQIVFQSSSLPNTQTQGISGKMPVRAALNFLLQGTQLNYKLQGPHTLAISAQASEQNQTRPSAKPRTVQPPQAPEADQAAGLQEIIVTARKQSERLLDVPMSITAVSGSTLMLSGAATIADVARQIAGLNVVSGGPGQNQLILRGVSSSGGVPTVGFYINDTPLASPLNFQAGSVMDPALLDLDRVEVLRGPQGTLYGASSMGGTVKYVTTQPNLQAEQAYIDARVSGTQGGGPNYDISALLNEPLIPDLAAIRVSAFYRDADGYIDRFAIDPNNYLAALGGTRSRDVNTESSYGARVTFEIKPNDTLLIEPWFWIQHTRLGAPFTIDAPPGSFDNLIQTRDVSEPTTDRLGLAALTVEADLSALHLTSSTSYRDRLFDVVEDDSKLNYFFFSPSPQSYVYPAPFANHFGDHDFTEEIRGALTFARVRGLVGVFYHHAANFQTTSFPVPEGYNSAFGSPFGAQPFYASMISQRSEQKALFGELTFLLSEKLEATAGARVFEVTQHDASTKDGVFNGGFSTDAGSSRDTGTNPKFDLSYHLTPDVLAYATAAKGFREGGPLLSIPATVCGPDLAAIGLTGAPTAFRPDTLWNYETGLKSSWLDHRLTVNAAVYYIDWKDIQQLVALPTCGYSFTGNFGKAISKGSELEVQYELVRDLRLAMAVSFNDAVLTATVPGAQGQPGDTLENAPRWMGSASAEYRTDLTPETSGYARIDFSTTSNQFNNFDSRSIYYSRPGYSLANLRIGARHNAWDVALFLDNVMDKHFEASLPLSYAADLPTTRRLAVNRPRTIGLEARLDLFPTL